jgi:hypothetical protein
MVALNHLGYDPLKEVPIVTKIKEDIKKFNNKNQVIGRIKELEKEFYYEIDKKTYIWTDEENEKSGKQALKSRSFDSFGSKPGTAATVFHPVRVKELNSKTGVSKKLDMHDSLQIMNSYLVEADAKQQKLQARQEKMETLGDNSDSSVVDHAKKSSATGQSSNKFLAKLVHGDGDEAYGGHTQYNNGEEGEEEEGEEFKHQEVSEVDLGEMGHIIDVIYEDEEEMIDGTN